MARPKRNGHEDDANSHDSRGLPSTSRGDSPLNKALGPHLHMTKEHTSTNVMHVKELKERFSNHPNRNESDSIRDKASEPHLHISNEHITVMDVNMLQARFSNYPKVGRPTSRSECDSIGDKAPKQPLLDKNPQRLLQIPGDPLTEIRTYADIVRSSESSDAGLCRPNKNTSSHNDISTNSALESVGRLHSNHREARLVDFSNFLHVFGSLETSNIVSNAY